jgi:PAS domain S-box-containing protein
MNHSSHTALANGASSGLSPELDRLLHEVKASPENRTPDAALRLADACERLAAELARREAKDHEHLHKAAVVECANLAIVSTDLQGIIRSWNPAAERLFGHRAHEMLGKPMLLLIPEGAEQEEARILERLKLGQHIVNYQTLRRHQGGHLLPVSLSIFPVRNDQDKIVGAAKIARDMTSHRELHVKSELTGQLQGALSEFRTLQGFIAVCAHCKKIRDEHGFWQTLELYLSRRTAARFSHGVCPVCLDKHYGRLLSPQS